MQQFFDDYQITYPVETRIGQVSWDGFSHLHYIMWRRQSRFLGLFKRRWEMLMVSKGMYTHLPGRVPNGWRLYEPILISGEENARKFASTFETTREIDLHYEWLRRDIKPSALVKP